MKIFVNADYEILSLDIAPQKYAYCLDSSLERDKIFGNFCDAVVKGHKYEPQYEMIFNEDGSNARDEKTGDLLYKLDENGEKIPAGYACYPFIDYKTLMLIQKQYEDSQKQIQALNAQIEYLSMMFGIETEVSHE